jgi:hypothetical protein
MHPGSLLLMQLQVTNQGVGSRGGGLGGSAVADPAAAADGSWGSVYVSWLARMQCFGHKAFVGCVRLQVRVMQSPRIAPAYTTTPSCSC